MRIFESVKVSKNENNDRTKKKKGPYRKARQGIEPI